MIAEVLIISVTTLLVILLLGVGFFKYKKLELAEEKRKESTRPVVDNTKDINELREEVRKLESRLNQVLLSRVLT